VDDGSKTVHVQYRDQVGHVSLPYDDAITVNTIPPSSSATSPASESGLSFTMSWSGSDNVSGSATYDVQYRVGNVSVWTPWLSETTDHSFVFGPTSRMTVVRGEIYYFRVRTRDNAGNLETYPEGDGDTGTFVKQVFMIYLPLAHRDY
jgi:hypothetical protein